MSGINKLREELKALEMKSTDLRQQIEFFENICQHNWNKTEEFFEDTNSYSKLSVVSSALSGITVRKPSFWQRACSVCGKVMDIARI